MLPDLHTGFSRGRSGGLVFPSLPEFSTVYCDPHKGFGIVNKAEIDAFLERSSFFHDPAAVGNLISGSSAFSKTSLNIWKFTVHVLLKPGLENFEHYYTSMLEKAVAPHSSTLAWKIPQAEEPGRLQSMGSLRVRHDSATSLSLFTFMHWRRKWQPTPSVIAWRIPWRGSLVVYCLWGCTESDTTEAT